MALHEKVQELVGLHRGMQEEIDFAYDNLQFQLDKRAPLDSVWVQTAFRRIKNLRKKQTAHEEMIEEISNEHHD